MLKRVAILLVCLLMVFIATFSFIVGVVAVPTIYSYAEQSYYQPLNSQSDLVKAFQSYCKSRDLTIEGSVADALTTYTTSAFNGACNTLGINVSQLQAEIKAEYDDSGKPVKFFFNSTGVMAMNRIFAQFLQDNDLQVGESLVNKEVFNGNSYEGNLIWITASSSVGGSATYPNPNILQRGSYFKYSREDVINLVGSSLIYQIDQNTYTYPVILFNGTTTQNYTAVNAVSILYGNVDYASINNTVSGTIQRGSIWTYDFIEGYPIIFQTASGSSINIGIYYKRMNTNNGEIQEGINRLNIISPPSQDVQPTTIYIKADTINNNYYEGDTYINDEGDIINENQEPSGGTPPNWDLGGGDGSATDGNGNTWNIQFPDFELPDLNIDWQIHGLGDKFPFSIPFDLVALVTVLNAEPEAPRFEGTVNFGFTTWDYDINLEQFDTVASACRIAEILLLVFGLILVTRSIIKG